MTSGLSIAVVGGSIGGLTAACLLRDDGHDVTVFERSPAQLEQRGAGIGLLHETSRYLVERRGESVDDVSVLTDHIRYLNRDSSIAADYDHVYRFSSWNAVYRRLLSHWDVDRYLLGHEMVGFGHGDVRSPVADGGAPVTARFANGVAVNADLLVCCDGTGSTARQVIAPDARFAYAGYVAWRGMVPESEFAPAEREQLVDAITYYVYANSHILVYPIPGLDGSVLPGERLINFVWYRNYMEGSELNELLGTTGEVDHASPKLSVPPGGVASHQLAELRAHANARVPALLAEVVARTEQPFLQVVYDVEVDTMVQGRACLLGDSAVVARPHAAAGSAKAADDAWALAAALRDASSVDEALAAYEPDRVALGSSLLDRTRLVGGRSQIYNTWRSDDPNVIFGLRAPGD